MKMKKSLLVFGIMSLILSGCKNDGKKELTTEEMVENIDDEDARVIDDHNSRNALDWAGVYEGTLPCADCEGIKTVIELKDDNTYTTSQTYLKGSENTEEFNSKGSFNWDDSGSNITLKDGEETFKYKVGENQLLMLDSEGNMVDGKLSDLYILKKKTE